LIISAQATTPVLVPFKTGRQGGLDAWLNARRRAIALAHAMHELAAREHEFIQRIKHEHVR
jgi:hypothetical protein